MRRSSLSASLPMQLEAQRRFAARSRREYRHAAAENRSPASPSLSPVLRERAPASVRRETTFDECLVLIDRMALPRPLRTRSAGDSASRGSVRASSTVYWSAPRRTRRSDSGERSVWGMEFLPIAIGLAAGFDKDARVIDAMLILGLRLCRSGAVYCQAATGKSEASPLSPRRRRGGDQPP